MNKAVFLDRDGVINKDDNFVNKPEDLELYPWTAGAIKKFKEAGFKVFIVTNQGGIELGYMTEEELQAIHKRLELLLEAEGTSVDDIEHCPHYKSKCKCRKPKPGMLLKLAKKHGIDLEKSYMVGDRESDIEAGNRAGCTTVKVKDDDCDNYDYYASDLDCAVDVILGDSSGCMII